LIGVISGPGKVRSDLGTEMQIITLEVMSSQAERHKILTEAGIGVSVAADADDLVRLLDTIWPIHLVVADVALLTSVPLAKLSREGGPRILAIVGDHDSEAAGVAMAADLVGFIPRNIIARDYLDAVEHALDHSALRGVADLSDTGIAQIGALSAEVERIVTALATLAAGERRIAAGGPLPVTVVQVRAIIKARRLRERFFPAALFADPVWDMLLDLTAARLEDKPVAVSSLCLAAAVPTTTALRQIKALCDAGMFVRRVDLQDARRTFIELSETSAQSMLDYLGSLRGDGPVI